MAAWLNAIREKVFGAREPEQRDGMTQQADGSRTRGLTADDFKEIRESAHRVAYGRGMATEDHGFSLAEQRIQRLADRTVERQRERLAELQEYSKEHGLSTVQLREVGRLVRALHQHEENDFQRHVDRTEGQTDVSKLDRQIEAVTTQYFLRAQSQISDFVARQQGYLDRAELQDQRTGGALAREADALAGRLRPSRNRDARDSHLER
jgi:hypothetical protein